MELKAALQMGHELATLHEQYERESAEFWKRTNGYRYTDAEVETALRESIVVIEQMAEMVRSKMCQDFDDNNRVVATARLYAARDALAALVNHVVLGQEAQAETE